MLFRTRWGLRMRAVGEHPKAADTVGIKVNGTRCEHAARRRDRRPRRRVLHHRLGGAFGKEMTAGKGFIALAAMILGRWSPIGALLAALLFGFADSLQTGARHHRDADPEPVHADAARTWSTIFAVAGLVGRVRAPAAEGEPVREGLTA